MTPRLTRLTVIAVLAPLTGCAVPAGDGADVGGAAAGPPEQAPVTRYRCGDTAVDLVGTGATAWLNAGCRRYRLERVRTASGAKYAGRGGAVSVWSHGARARVVLDGRVLPECVAALSRPYEARGNEPGWHLELRDSRLVLVADYGERRVDRPAPAPEPVAGGRRYRAPGSGGADAVTVTVREGPCADDMTGMPHPHRVEVSLDGRTLRGCGGDPRALLAGRRWRVTGMPAAGHTDAGAYTLRFRRDGRVTGRAAGRRYAGTYTLTPATLRLSGLAAAGNGAAPRLLRLLADVRRFGIADDGALILHTGDGRRLRAVGEAQ
ncbi:hypothetical protein KBTX_00159 [wastewater metagenome]|uniref:C-type lysozyme inhibitor domain-containing protein n=2 Tax=unclassified sequences TaxID=12908 RepID=A0A5B8R535_9ZZZZ|nr:META domain-containing protein [Arhodomonas sp. KWT]QEA03859.1 hypothetical protein KBTEX_00159 [uncultured organism]